MRTHGFVLPRMVPLLAARIAALVCCLLYWGSAVYGEVLGELDVELSTREGNENECAGAVNPSNKDQLFVVCNKYEQGQPGLFAARSVDGGRTWIDRTPVGGVDPKFSQFPQAWVDPSVAWDSFGNLYLTYLSQPPRRIVVWLSTDAGVTFEPLTVFGDASFFVDQPTVVAANTSAPGAPSPVAVWIVWKEDHQLKARGAAVNGSGSTPGNVGPFLGDPANGDNAWVIPAPEDCTYGDIAIAPSGAVVNVCQVQDPGSDPSGPSSIIVNTKADGLNSNQFAPAVTVTSTNVGQVRFIPASLHYSVDAEAGLAFDMYPSSPHFGRLYLVYTEATVVSVPPWANDTDIMVRFSDDNGMTWSEEIRVNDDTTRNSQFLPRIATNPGSGNIAVCWLDARNDPDNQAVQTFCSIATPTGAKPTFLPNVQMSKGSSTSKNQDRDFGDYIGLTYFEGVVRPFWPDRSNGFYFDPYTSLGIGRSAASEGDPHITTLGGVPYDFQSAGEFVALRGDGLEIQTRQTPIATPFPVSNPHTDLTTCVSLISAVAARVGTHRVTYQPNISGTAKPGNLELWVDGRRAILDAQGIDLGSGGRIVKSAIGDGVEVDFPNGTYLIATPGRWKSQSMWYMNVNIYNSTASEGIMGVIGPNSWLPALPDGGSLGGKPILPSHRYFALNQTFANAWRVTKTTSLFHYASDTSTATFTTLNWPLRVEPCSVPKQRQAKPFNSGEASKACRKIVDDFSASYLHLKSRQDNCIFDVTVTGETGFARTYELTQRLEAGATMTAVHADKDRTQAGESVTFTASVVRKASGDGNPPTGSVQFFLDGVKTGTPVELDRGRACWPTGALKVGKHKVSARYIPSRGSWFVRSSSLHKTHQVVQRPPADASSQGLVRHRVHSNRPVRQ